jgi:hypothetical protein
MAEAKEVTKGIDALLPRFVAAQKNRFGSRNETDAQTLNAIQAQADELATRHELVINKLQRLTGIPEEVFQQLEKARILGESGSPRLRNDLTVDRVAATNDIDESLPTALEEMLRLVDLKWLRADESEQHRLSETKTGEPLSLLKGARRRSEFPESHRFLQALRVAADYLEGHPAYDLLPALCSCHSWLASVRELRS